MSGYAGDEDTDEDTLIGRINKWQKVLYIVNTCTFVRYFPGLSFSHRLQIFGILIVALAAAAQKVVGATIAVPVWTFNVAIAFGSIISIISCFGCLGAFRAPNLIANNKKNHALTIYFGFLVVGLIMQLTVAGALLQLNGTIRNAKAENYEDEAAASFEKELEAWTSDHPSDWMTIQSTLGCCGYNSTIDVTATWTSGCPTATGYNETVCLPAGVPKANQTCITEFVPTGVDTTKPNANAITCRLLLLNKARNSAGTVGMVAIVFAMLEAMALLSAVCLLYCIKPDPEKDEAAAATSV